MRVLAVCFRYSEGWTPSNEALATPTFDCKYLKKSMWHNNRCMFIEATGKWIPTCRFKIPNCEFFERTYDNATDSQSLRGKIKNMEAAEDFESRLRKAVTFRVERGKEFQELCELKGGERARGVRCDGLSHG